MTKGFQNSLKKALDFQMLRIMTVAVLCGLFPACSTVRLQMKSYDDKKPVLPQNMKSAEEDADIIKETSCIVTSAPEGKFLIRKESVGKDQMTEKIADCMKDKTPDKRIVYLEIPQNERYTEIVTVLELIRKADIDKVGLVVRKTTQEKAGIERPSRFEIKLHVSSDEMLSNKKPNPLFLLVEADKTGRLLLNKEGAGEISEGDSLLSKLTNVFKDRESNGVFREGTNEVEKTVAIKASRALSYGDVAKLVDLVKQTGAQPISLQIDDLSD